MGRLSRLFKRFTGRADRQPSAPSVVIDRRIMNEDWRPGDLAVCVADGFMPGHPADPKKGQLLRVAAIKEALAWRSPVLMIGLSFEGLGADLFWQCTAFRKVRPKAEEADAEFVADIKRRARPRVDA